MNKRALLGFSLCFISLKLLAVFRSVVGILAVKRAMRVSPGSVARVSACLCETVVPARRTRRIIGLETRWLFQSARFNPLQPLNSREINNEGVKSAPSEFIRHSRQISIGQFLDVLGLYGTSFPPGLLFLRSRRLVQRRSSHQTLLIAVEDVALTSSDLWVNRRRAKGALPQKKLLDKLAAADNSEESTSAWSQRLSHSASPPRWKMFRSIFLAP